MSKKREAVHVQCGAPLSPCWLLLKNLIGISSGLNLQDDKIESCLPKWLYMVVQHLLFSGTCSDSALIIYLFVMDCYAHKKTIF